MSPRRYLKLINRLGSKLPLRKLLISALFLIAVSGGVYAYLGQTVTRDVSYGDCEVEHGELLGSWQGQGDEPWNESGYYYEARRFAVSASSQQNFWFRNVAEQDPHFISSAGADGCRPDLSGLIDTAAPKFRWEGARAVDARLGVPDLGDVNQSGAFAPAEQLRPDSALTPPVYGRDGARAAVMVDDAARAILATSSDTRQLWCFHSDFAGSDLEDCESKRSFDSRLRGAGYLFVADNCPDIFREANVACARAADWYSQIELSESIGKNRRGELKAFSLDLEAVSAFAPRAGASMTLVFKFATFSRIEAVIDANTVKLDPEERLELEVKLSKTGPDLSNLSLSTTVGRQPLTGAGINLELNNPQLATLNKTGSLVLTTSHRVDKQAKRSQCHEYQVDLSTSDTGEVSIEQPRFSYCIKAARQISYTYSVKSLGKVKASLPEFASQVTETLNHRLGWGSVGITFNKVDTGGDFVVYLASPAQVDAASSGCDATYSCQVGNGVYINDERWRKATPSWNDSGGSLRDYRHMVVNHETGHWLGFGHLNCPGAGQMAPVMQQQSINLQGCKHNPWPTKSELDSLKSRLNL